MSIISEMGKFRSRYAKTSTASLLSLVCSRTRGTEARSSLVLEPERQWRQGSGGPVNGKGEDRVRRQERHSRGAGRVSQRSNNCLSRRYSCCRDDTHAARELHFVKGKGSRGRGRLMVGGEENCGSTRAVFAEYCPSVVPESCPARCYAVSYFRWKLLARLQATGPCSSVG